MKMARKFLSPALMVRATETSDDCIRGVLVLASNLQTDPRQEQRRLSGFCLWCFYGGRGGAGAVLTEAPCSLCGKLQSYGTALTDELCLDCAHDHDLCKRCGGDVNRRTRRRNWPTPRPEIAE